MGEVVRLNEMLAEKVTANNKLQRENETMRFKIKENLNHDTQVLGRSLKEHSIYETNVLNQTFVDLSKESDENKINELERENTAKTEQIEKLQYKIRKLSTVDIEDFEDKDEMRRFVGWSRKLSWPDVIEQIYENQAADDDDDDYYLLMQRVLMEEKRISKEECVKLRELGETQRREYLFDIENLKKKINELKRAHKSSMAQLPNPFTVNSPDAALHLLEDQNANKIQRLEKKLEKQRKEHLKDKQIFVMSTMNELNRLRSEIKDVGLQQQQQQQQNDNDNNDNSYYSYISSATSYLWNYK